MPNIRIKDIPTTASATSSTDFIGIDGSANGTRKLDAYSPTFGGNLTVSGTGTSSIGGNTKIGNPANANQRLVVDGAVAGVGAITTNTGLSGGYLYSDGGTGGVVAAWNGGNYSALSILGNTVTIGTGASGTTAATISSSGNLTVSGTGTSSFSGSLSVAGQASTINNSTLVMDFNTSGDYGRLLAKNSGGAYTTAIQVVNPLTLQSNLTVSGTGTSSFGGKIQSSVATATGYNQLYDTTGITTGRGAFAITSTGAGLAFGIEASVGGTSFTGSTAYASYFGTTTATPIHFVTNSAISATLTSGGNYLIGTTTDGGQKLQVSGTAAITGQIRGANIVASNVGSADAGFYGTAGGDAGSAHRFALVRTDTPSGGSALLSAYAAAVVEVNATSGLNTGTRALTIDTSANATFAGTVKIANTAEIKGVYTTTTTFDFGTIANNDASSVCTLTMTGVSSSDSIIVSPTDGDNFPQFCTVSAVPSGNTVAIRLYNGSGSSRTVGSRSIRVTAIKF